MRYFKIVWMERMNGSVLDQGIIFHQTAFTPDIELMKSHAMSNKADAESEFTILTFEESTLEDYNQYLREGNRPVYSS